MLRDMDTHIVPALKMRLENVHRHKRQREERESVPNVQGVHRAGGPCVGGPARRELSRSACWGGGGSEGRGPTVKTSSSLSQGQGLGTKRNV